MSRHCPSCGSTVRDEDSLCPVCGENLAPDAQAAPARPLPRENEPAATEPVSPRVSPQPAASGTIICPECGAQNASGSAECTVCGSTLAADVPMAVPAGTAPERRAIPSSSMRDYLLSTIAAVVIGAVVLLVSTPEEKTGPPRPPDEHGGGGAQMQQGHNHPGGPANGPVQPTPQQLQTIADAEKAVAASPSDLNAKLKLANLYYDIDRHAQAVPLYREYVKAHPENLNARTDMAYSIASSGSLDNSVAELHAVLEKDPKFQNAVYNLAMIYIAKRNRDSTLYWLQRTMEIDPSSRAGQFASQVLNGVKSGLMDSTGAAQ